MSIKQKVVWIGSAIWLAAALPGCVVDTTADDVIVVPERTGILTVATTIDGDTNPNACAYWGVDYLELIIYDSFGREFVDAEAPCEDFAVSVELPRGDYSADATLIEASGAPVSVTLPLDALRVTPDTELTVEVDFPSSSML
jgi:hypothetical protein